MSTLTPTFALIIDSALPGGAYPLLTAAGASATIPQWTAGDIFDLSIRFAQRSATLGGALTYLPLAGSWTITAGLKSNRASATSLIASASDFGLSETDIYTAELSLDTAEVLALIASGTAVSVWMDIEVANAGNTRRATYQFPIQINPQVYGAGETDPTPEEPAYPAPGAIPVRIVGSVAIPVGVLSLDVVVDSDRDYIPVCMVRKPLATDPNIIAVSTHSLTQAGFTVQFSSDAEKEGYILDYIAF
jgi:hypothetical protein